MTAAMNEKEIRAAAPAVFGYPASRMSENYGHIKTKKLIDFFGEHGFAVIDAQQDKPRARDPKTVARMLQFQREDTLNVPVKKVGEYAPRILLRNSHNGRTCLRLNVGVYRFVCMNGMVVGDDILEASLRHSANVNDVVGEYLSEFNDNARITMDRIASWREREVSTRKANNFARKAAVLRFGKDGDKLYKPEELLQTRRAEDEGNTVWAVFNRVQENTVAQSVGGVNASGRHVRSRPLTSIASSVEYNKQLWALAEQTLAA